MASDKSEKIQARTDKPKKQLVGASKNTDSKYPYSKRRYK